MTIFDNSPHTGRIAHTAKAFLSTLACVAAVLSLSACGATIEPAPDPDVEQGDVLAEVAQRIGSLRAQCPAQYRPKYTQYGSINVDINTSVSAFTGDGRYCTFLMPNGDFIQARMYYVEGGYIMIDEATSKQL